MRRQALLALLALAGCSSEPPPPAPKPTARATPSPRPTLSPRALKPGQLPIPELDGATPLRGSWSATPMAAVYGEDGGLAFAIRCDRPARRILLSAAAKAGGSLRLFTADAAARFPAQMVDGALESPVTTGQTFLDALARADAIGIAVDDGEVRRIPGDKAIARVVRGCRPAGR